MNEKVNSDLLLLSMYKIALEINSNQIASRLKAFEREKMKNLYNI